MHLISQMKRKDSGERLAEVRGEADNRSLLKTRPWLAPRLT